MSSKKFEMKELYSLSIVHNELYQGDPCAGLQARTKKELHRSYISEQHKTTSTAIQ